MARDRARATATDRAQRHRKRDIVRSLKEAPCTDCGGRFPPVCMDFDHLDSTDKTAEVSKLMANGYSLQRVLDEIAKCELVCSNCHRIRTEARRVQKLSEDADVV